MVQSIIRGPRRLRWPVKELRIGRSLLDERPATVPCWFAIATSRAVAEGGCQSEIHSINKDCNASDFEVPRLLERPYVESYFSVEGIRRFVPGDFLGVDACGGREGVRYDSSSNGVFVRLASHSYSCFECTLLVEDLRLFLCSSISSSPTFFCLPVAWTGFFPVYPRCRFSA